MERKLVPFGIKGERGSWRQHLMLRYGLDEKDWSRLFERQQGKCPGCGGWLADQTREDNEGEGLRAWVDWKGEKPGKKQGRVCEAHQVRGLVCTDCRGWIAELEQPKSLTRKLLDYLTRSE
jgi:hypothetical protein